MLNCKQEKLQEVWVNQANFWKFSGEPYGIDVNFRGVSEILLGFPEYLGFGVVFGDLGVSRGFGANSHLEPQSCRGKTPNKDSKAIPVMPSGTVPDKRFALLMLLLLGAAPVEEHWY